MPAELARLRGDLAAVERKLADFEPLARLDGKGPLRLSVNPLHNVERFALSRLATSALRSAPPTTAPSRALTNWRSTQPKDSAQRRPGRAAARQRPPRNIRTIRPP